MSTPVNGLPLELYYIDGDPDGMVTAEMFNWTGHVLMAPRTQLSAALARREARYAGVYLLLGERDGEPFTYIGEGDDIGERIKLHDVNKDWWRTAVFVTATNNKLNKAHGLYLEARLIQEVDKIRRTLLENVKKPTPSGLSEADISKMESFLRNLFIVLPAVRVDIFIQRSRPEPTKPALIAPITESAPIRFVMKARMHGLTASAILVDGEFIVEKGSLARLQWEGQAEHSYEKQHRELLREGVLRPEGAHCIFTQNYAFKSPSAAAAVVNGRPSNGTTDWRTEDGDQTYKDWEAQQLRTVAA